jgi:hypothetical protein
LSLALCRRSCTGKQLCAHGRTGCRREEKVPTSRWLHGRGECMGDRTAMTVRAESTRPSQKRGVLASAGLCSLSSVITHGPLTTSSRLSRPASPVSLSRQRALHHEANQKGRSCMDHHQTTKPDQKNCGKELLNVAERWSVLVVGHGPWAPFLHHTLLRRGVYKGVRETSRLIKPRSEARPSVLTRVRPETLRRTWPCRRTGAVAKSGNAMRTCSCAR